LEFDRLEALAHEREHLAGEVMELKHRVSALETEVQRLLAQSGNPARPAGTAG
jgi:uncharacterized small protein (DUF1192 family)